MNLLILLVVKTLMSTNLSFADTCPIAPNRVKLSVAANVKYDGASKLYTYSYSLKNEPNSPLSGWILRLMIDQPPQQVVSPSKWHDQFYSEVGDPRTTRFQWSTGLNLAPGKSLSGFSFKSPYPSGAIKYHTVGATGVPTSTPNDTSDEPVPNCPDFFYDKTEPFGAEVVGVTIGPISNGTISPEMKLLRGEPEKREWEKIKKPLFKMKANGKIKALLFASETFDPSRVEIKSIAFGPGKAAAISSKVIGQGKDKAKKSVHALLLTFEEKDLKITCNIDQALFISGKMLDGKPFFSGAEIEPELCTRGLLKDRIPKEPLAH